MSVTENSEQNEKQIEEKSNSKKIQMSLPIIFFLVSFIALAISVGLVIIPKYQEIEETKLKITEEDTSIKLLEQQTVSLKVKEKELLEKQKEEEANQEIKRIIPTEYSITNLLETIDFYTHESKGYKLNQIDIGEPIPFVDDPLVSEVLITFRLNCTPDKLIDLINNLEQEQQIFIIDKFKIQGEARVLNTDGESELKLRTFYVTKI